MTHDRREFQRLRLAKPILARMGSDNALILDLGIAGAFVEHYGTTEPGKTFDLSFRWQGQEVKFVCEIVRTAVVREQGGNGRNAVSHSGVHFIEAVEDSTRRLEDLMATYVGQVLAAQRANAAGDPQLASSATVLAGLGGARRKRTKGFISYRLKDGSWWRVPTDSPRQPEDGFTVAAWEDESELEALCRTYAGTDEEGRRLIRLVAELSVRS